MTVATGNEVQVVTLTSATGGTFTLTYAGQTTSALAFDAANTTVQTALRALSTIGAGNVTVTGNAGGPYTVTFTGALRDTDVAQMTASNASLTGSGHAIAVTTSTAGNPAVTELAYADISVANGAVANVQVLVGQTPPAGVLLVDSSDYYGN